MTPGEAIYERYRHLSRELDPLARSIVEKLPAVHAVYDPLVYASRPWRTYLARFVDGPRGILFLGMNPGPWGMAQTGIPFGEIDSVRDWMGIEEPVDQPDHPHPKRPVEGFRCRRSEVSGRRFWGLMRDRFGTAERCFQDQAVLNFCPLVFMGESGKNITPNTLPSAYRTVIEEACRGALRDATEILRPRHLVGVGRFAEKQLKLLRETTSHLAETPDPIAILHPSPASPSANSGWSETVTAQLQQHRVWA
jgi:single-strand selective monofunctional uracil DNA glycosylase